MSTVYSLFQYLFECMKKGLKMTKEKKPVIDEYASKKKKRRKEKKSKKYPFVSYCFLLVHSFAYFSCFVFCHFESNCYGNNIMFQFSRIVYVFTSKKSSRIACVCVCVSVCVGTSIFSICLSDTFYCFFSFSSIACC